MKVRFGSKYASICKRDSYHLDGRFAQMVCINSLVSVRKQQVIVNPDKLIEIPKINLQNEIERFEEWTCSSFAESYAGRLQTRWQHCNQQVFTTLRSLDLYILRTEGLS